MLARLAGRCAGRRWGLAAAACSVSLGLLQKHASLLFAPLLVVGYAALLSSTEGALRRCPRLARWSVLLGFPSAGVALFLFRGAYPEWNLRVDRDEALDLAVRELLAGRYPYAARTHLDNPISPLPGSLLLALPFVLLGSSAYQNWGWGALALLLVIARFGWDKAAIAMVAAFACLAVTQEWLFGGDLISLALCSAAAVGVVVASGERPRMRPWAALALGVVLTTRPNLAFVLLTLLLWSLRTCQLRALWPVLMGAAGVELALVAAFYLWNPDGFSPLHLVHKLEGGALGNLTVVVLPLMALVAVAAGARRGGEWGGARLFLELSLVQTVPLVVMVVAHSLHVGAPSFLFLKERYGVVPFLWCVVAWLLAAAADARFSVPGSNAARKVCDPDDLEKIEHARARY